jgi:arylsulfatase A-like enzyme
MLIIKSTATQPSKLSLWWMLILLTLLFVYAQISYYFVKLATAGLINVLISSSITTDVILSWVVFKPLLIFVTTHLLLYCVLVFVLWYVATSIGDCFKMTYGQIYLLGMVLWISSVILILAANSIYFNLSLFAFDSSSGLSSKQIHFAYAISLAVILFAMVLALVKSKLKYLILTLGALIALFNMYPISITNASHSQSNKPNIILIAIEALRPDFVDARTMPFLSQWLSDSTQYTDAYTPIAQTFPAWISLLTSKAPMHHGARSLYTAYSSIDLSESLITKFKDAGYDTFYAADAQRFGDITQELGFNHVISPPYGAAELLITSLSDFPLVNLISATPIGKYLFPYNYANRSNSVTYQPNDFVELLQNTINTNNDKPVFFAVHFGVSHWPYRWAGDQQAKNLSLPDKYRYSLHAADDQIKQFITSLLHANLLQNTIIVMFSDHGTGLGLRGDRLLSRQTLTGKNNNLRQVVEWPYSDGSHHYGFDTSYGYSTDILSLAQQHILLAFKQYGKEQKTIRSNRVSLLDVAPTLLDVLGMQPFKNADGISLGTSDNHRMLYLENGFTTPEIAKANIATDEVVRHFPSVALDHKTGLLYITKEAQQRLLQQKQRAIFYDHWILARYPQSTRYSLVQKTKFDRSMVIKSEVVPPYFILVNTKTKQWTMDLSSDFAMNAPIKLLMSNFTQYNSSEI